MALLPGSWWFWATFSNFAAFNRWSFGSRSKWMNRKRFLMFMLVLSMTRLQHTKTGSDQVWAHAQLLQAAISSTAATAKPLHRSRPCRKCVSSWQSLGPSGHKDYVEICWLSGCLLEKPTTHKRFALSAKCLLDFCSSRHLRNSQHLPNNHRPKHREESWISLGASMKWRARLEITDTWGLVLSHNRFPQKFTLCI